MTAPMAERWEQRGAARRLPEERGVELLSDLVFRDVEGQCWQVLVGTCLPGCAIPTALSPPGIDLLAAGWRDAMLLHAWYCAERSQPWAQTQLLLPAALRAAGISAAMANRAFLAALWAAPRWERLRVANNNLRPADYFSYFRPNRSLIGNNGFEMGARQAVIALRNPWQRLGAAERTTLARRIWRDPAIVTIDPADLCRQAALWPVVGGDGFEPPALSV